MSETMKDHIKAHQELEEAQRDYHRALLDIHRDYHRTVEDIQDKYTRWPLTAMGAAIRNYIHQYLEQRANE